MKALELKPNHTNALVIRGGNLAVLGRFQEALETLLKCHEIAPSQIEPLQMIAEIYRQLSNTKEAIHYLEKVYKLDPSSETNRSYGLNKNICVFFNVKLLC